MELEPAMQVGDIRAGDGDAKMASRNKALRTAMADPKNYSKQMLGRAGPVLAKEQIGKKDLKPNTVHPWEPKYRKKRGRLDEEEEEAE